MMVCPACRSEYRDGFTHCKDCYAELVAADSLDSGTQPASGKGDLDLVPVFETRDPSLVPIARSLLESANIEFVTRGEGPQDLFGPGRSGPVVFEVDRPDAAEALEILADLRAESSRSGAEEPEGKSDECAFAVLRSRGPAWDDSKPLEGQADWAAHAAFMDALFEEGFAALVGPLEGTRDALLILRASSASEVAERIASDPWSSNGLLVTKQINPWQIRLGTLKFV